MTALLDFNICIRLDHTSGGGGTFRLQQGDLIHLLEPPPSLSLQDDWAYGRCERTREKGTFPQDAVFVLCTLDKPTPEFLVRAIRNS